MDTEVTAIEWIKLVLVIGVEAGKTGNEFSQDESRDKSV